MLTMGDNERARETNDMHANIWYGWSAQPDASDDFAPTPFDPLLGRPTQLTTAPQRSFPHSPAPSSAESPGICTQRYHSSPTPASSSDVNTSASHWGDSGKLTDVSRHGMNMFHDLSGCNSSFYQPNQDSLASKRIGGSGKRNVFAGFNVESYPASHQQYSQPASATVSSRLSGESNNANAFQHIDYSTNLGPITMLQHQNEPRQEYSGVFLPPMASAVAEDPRHFSPPKTAATMARFEPNDFLDSSTSSTGTSNSNVVKPLNAYNFFYSDMREWMIHLSDEEMDTLIPRLPKRDHCDAEEEQKAQVLGKVMISMQKEKLPTEERKKRLLLRHLNRDRSARRRHRKAHGKISFCQMNTLVSIAWSALPQDDRAFYHDLAKLDRKRYQEESGLVGGSKKN